MENFNEVSMQLILHSGDAKGSAMQAVEAARSNDFETANQLIKEAKQNLVLAHQAQTDLLHAEARGESATVTILMVHAQDHMMNASTFVDTTIETINLYKEIQEIRKELVK